MTDFDRIFDLLSEQDRAELAARTSYWITDQLADRIRAAGAGLRQPVTDIKAGWPGGDGIIQWGLSGWYLTPAFSSYLGEHGLPRAHVE